MSAISDLLTIEAFARCSEDVDEADLARFVRGDKVVFSDQQAMGQFLMEISEGGRLIKGLLGDAGESRKICSRGGEEK